MNNRRRTAVLLVCVATIAFLKIRASAQTSGGIDHAFVSIFDARPLAAAALALEQRLGIPITYEDAEWEYVDDIMRAADSGEATRLRPDVLLVRPGRVDLRFPVDRNTGRPVDAPNKLLEDMLAEHAAGKNSGEFRALQVGDGYSIVPARRLDKSGQLVAAVLPLDTRISLSDELRSGQETLRAICDAIQVASGKRIAPGAIQAGPFLEESVIRIGANNEVARDVLTRAVRELRYIKPHPMIRTSWSLYFDPDSKSYLLHLHELQQLVPAAGSRTLVARPVYVKP